MKTPKALPVLLITVAMACGLACSNKAKAPDVSASIRQALDQAGLKDVSVSQDRDKNLVTLTGNVATDSVGGGLSAFGTVEMRQSQFVGNRATGGGALFLASPDGFITNTLFLANQAQKRRMPSSIGTFGA